MCKWPQDLWSTLEVWAVLREGALTVWVWVPSADLVSEVNWLLDAQGGVGEPVAVGRDPACLESGTTPRLTLPYHLCMVWGSGPWDYITWGRALRTPAQFSAFSEFLAKSCTWLNVLWLVLVLPPTCFPSWASRLHFPLLNRGTRLHEFFERITSQWV